MIPPENFKLINPLIEKVTSSIILANDTDAEHHAMCIRFAVGDHRYLVTCRHAVEGVVANGCELWVRTQKSTIPLTNVFIMPKDRRLDIAVLRVPDEWDFSDESFLRITDTCSSFQPEGISCFLGGFLSRESNSWKVDSVQPGDKLQFASYISRTVVLEDAPPEFEPDFHFAIGGQIEENRLLNSHDYSSPIERIKSYGGFSGTAVFAVNDNPFNPGWTPYDYKVIGVQCAAIELLSKKMRVLKIIRFEAVISLIKRYFPDTRKLLEKLKSIDISGQWPLA